MNSIFWLLLWIKMTESENHTRHSLQRKLWFYGSIKWQWWVTNMGSQISYSSLNDDDDDVMGGRRLSKECVRNFCFLRNSLCCQTCYDCRVHTVHSHNWHNRKATGHLQNGLQCSAHLVDGSRWVHILRLGRGRLFAGWERHYWSDTLHRSLQEKEELK
jgi:hypothetical protein